MKILKGIIIAITAIILIPLVVALFVKNEYTIVREVTINKPKQKVFNYIKLLKNQDHYSKWVMTDPNARKNYNGTDGTVGFISAWDSDNKNLGKGEQEIKKITEGERIDLEIRFEKPMKGRDNVWMTTESAPENTTKVKWAFNGKMSYPMNFMVLFIDNVLGKDLQTSLQNLKQVLEQQG
jgi:uncharacterized protein YndB with AHSA1/START domain